MKIIITLKNGESIKIKTSLYSKELSKKIGEVLNNDSNCLFFNDGFDRKIIIVKELIKTIEFVEES